ncbi:sugar phosphate isomerase/epimerase family protein [Enterocloster lavalensis]|uniref:sugar phosphate isomerase/epimerase family protein n=1 Tax=Enterocloster lavalensis TaxID=460384 RepID=UPI001D0702BD|nr:sugar phosphate isomerase/epimerase [Enterocloster lavalensis]MCB6344689.1 sugar phosphate isomerase/epimerase [Enterocloster lavalensis]
MSEARKGAPKIALNMSMVKTIMWDKGPDYTFERVKAAGLSYFELSQVDMTDAFIDQVLEASAKHGVTVMSTSLNYKPLFGPNAKGFDIERDLKRIIEANKRLGVTYVRDSLIPRICIHSEEGYYKAAEDLNHYGKLLKEQGLKLYYHNHHFEFEKFNGKTGFELLVENTDPELVGFEIDVHWIQRAGHDPVKWIERLAGREDMVHLKDYRICFPDGEPTQEIFHREQCIQFAEIGEGNLDMKAIIEASVKGGAIYLPIEQDQTYGLDPFDCIRTSVKNIRDMGFGEYL